MSVYHTSLDIDDYFVLQDDEDYAFSQDSVLLANLAKLCDTDKVLDLGCGSGILSILAIVKKHVKHVLGIEVQPRVANMAKESAKLNGLEDKFEVVCEDVKNIRNVVSAESFDKVICNPPYFANTFNTPVCEKEISRRETTASLDDFIHAGAYALKFGGDMWLISKADRLAECMYSLSSHNLQPKELTLVYPKLSRGVDVTIIKARKGAKPGLVCNTFIAMNEDGEYTDEYKELYR